MSLQEMEWKGSRPQRFSGGKKIIKPEDELANFLSSSMEPAYQKGIRTYNASNTPEKIFKPSVRVFEDCYFPSLHEYDPRGKKMVNFPEQKDRIRPERVHVDGGKETTQEIDPRGIRIFEEANKSREKNHVLTKTWKNKGRVVGIEAQRNYLGVNSLGDKSYKYPEYSSNFYHSGGLIVGSTNRYYRRPNSELCVPKEGTVITKPNWDVRLKMEEADEERKALNYVDEWEKTILRE